LCIMCVLLLILYVLPLCYCDMAELEEEAAIKKLEEEAVIVQQFENLNLHARAAVRERSASRKSHKSSGFKSKQKELEPRRRAYADNIEHLYSVPCPLEPPDVNEYEEGRKKYKQLEVCRTLNVKLITCILYY